MIDKTQMYTVLADLFEDQARLVAALIDAHQPGDDLIWALMGGLDGLRAKALRRLDECFGGDNLVEFPGEEVMTPHPAIEEYLSKIRR